MGIGRQSEFSNRELAEKKFELVYGAATNDWSPRINSVNNILVRMNSRGFLLFGFTYLSISLDILAPISIQMYCNASITSEVLQAKSYNPRQIICIDDPTSAHSKGIGRQSEFSNRELAEKKFELVYGAATNDWSPIPLLCADVGSSIHIICLGL
jgi:hypothetical protein